MSNIFLLWLILASCSSVSTEESSAFEKGTFGYDNHFLRQHDPALITLQHQDRQVIVSPKYQGKVFTSTAEGNSGTSYGWINYELIASGEAVPHMNGYGGEDRFWLGPEGGQFSIFFEPGADMVYDNWFTPAAIDTEPFEVTDQQADRVQLKKEMELKNYANHVFRLTANRTIKLLSENESSALLETKLPKKVSFVGYESKNSITNQGNKAWTAETGTVCIWILGMFRPSPTATVVIPYQLGDEPVGPVATTDYFGTIPPDRIKIEDQVIYFKADGKKRSKLGVSQQRTTGFAGSYDESGQTLTVIQYSLPDEEKPYVNQRWEQQENPFQGDALNAYNDGPLEDGSQMGPFYELESSSPAAFLQPGDTLTHYHRTFHFSGEKDQLEVLSQKLLGVRIESIIQAF